MSTILCSFMQRGTLKKSLGLEIFKIFVLGVLVYVCSHVDVHVHVRTLLKL
jgi:hypothetical protein